jgi:hypothetical protein
MRPGLQAPSLNPHLDARLASLSIPDPPEPEVLSVVAPSDLPPAAEGAVSTEPAAESFASICRDEAALLTASPQGEEKEPIPSAENLLRQQPINEIQGQERFVPSERKGPGLFSRVAPSPKKALRNESPLSDSASKKGDEQAFPQKFTESILPEVSSSTRPDLEEVRPLFYNPSLQMEGLTSIPFSGAGVSEARQANLNARVTRFPSLLNEKVNDFIYFFQGKADSFFSRSLARSQAYEAMMKRIFREKNLPEELFYLALIESGYNPTALSSAKASGIWQFIAQTAKRFGLRVDKWVDERRDPEKSTYAAAEYLKTLYGMFNNWDLATAGYNAGEAKVLQAMKIAQSDDFWEISKRRYLKEETKKYVPMFLAAVTIAQEPQKYGFGNIDYHPPLVYEKVLVPPSTSLSMIAKASETDFSEIRALNPALIREKTPPSLPRFEIKVPMGKKAVFEKNFPLLCKSSVNKRDYRVRPGDTLSHIAKKHHVSVQDICTANGLSSPALLKPGAILKIPQAKD